MEFETVIGLEVHVELSTNTKIFCGCSTEFGAPPNTHTCPVCLGHPGVLPVLNKRAVEFAIKAGLALNCEIADESIFERKNYFYPDSPKAYQISQLDQAIAVNGWIEIEVDGKPKRIGITRLQLEEDAGKLTHADSGYASLVDFNRVGTPLIEIVSEPDLRSPEEARLYLEKLKSIVQYCEISDVKMEEGSFRCDANISLRPVGQEQFGKRAELKNVNSLRNVQRGLEYEEIRQAELLRDGEEVVQETRRWDDNTGRTFSMRSKEEAHDYRYFPDPDLIKMKIDPAWIEEIRALIPELPDARKVRYVEQYSLPEYDAGVLTMSKDMSDFFDATVQTGADAKAVSNWLMGETIGYLNANNLEFKQISLTPDNLGALVQLIEKGTISNKIAKKVFKEMMESGKSPEKIVEEQGLVQISDEGALKQMVDEVLAANPQAIEDFKAGKEKAMGALVGQIMKASKGKANPGVVNQLLRDALAKL
ncbi:Asp-tRNA(Asn)/Glu-tRNA(Gln) amidotransferase subunit GatB [Aneurinibacillus uraniidurans]|uniref:Asp-tRNA(Asn)/Glu-tRNA(Gln) amidotransferase subunit GatB n=1 Tax=Aneurinibacillus uraniidurans TaxID=2966586 RepID=UPI00234AD1AD|nr:Asp-tRNA(Asn)/Glu-tRNA(Gln) amidotransferase subunit GatB [Aneurinibacillus sp. B1]WCN37459.1 Asp-tRNA(Asn)/Glu-tRNA(Gln) amidotransferase subunit GatB [Aneurinibacillus sp. B1]